MNWKPGPVETEGAGPAKILYVTPGGRPLVLHADGREVLHFANGAPTTDRGWYRNLKPQRKELVIYLYRHRGGVEGRYRAFTLPPEEVDEDWEYLGSKILVEGEYVPGTEPQG